LRTVLDMERTAKAPEFNTNFTNLTIRG